MPARWMRTTYKINSLLLAMSCPYHPCCALKSASSASAATVYTSLPGAASRPPFVFPDPSDLRGCLGCFSSPIIRLMDLKKSRRHFRLCRFVKSSRTILFSRPFKEKSMCNSQVPLSAGGMGGQGRAQSAKELQDGTQRPCWYFVCWLFNKRKTLFKERIVKY